MKHLTSTLLATILLYASMGFACHVNKVALCDDVVSGFTLASAQFPSDKAFAELRTDGQAICDAVRNGKNGKNDIVFGLLKAFVPRFDAFVNQHGQSKGLALVDIGIHILLNHFPEQVRASRAAQPSVLAEYANRSAWGCQFYPERCKDGVPKE